MPLRHGPRRAAAAFVVFLLLMLIVPLGWHAVLQLWGPAAAAQPASYLPTLEPARHREPFKSGPVEDLAGMSPGYVIIGDSMGGRIEPDRLTALAQMPVAPLLQNATGSAYWYLVLKNWVVASGVKPKRVIIFFRDNNLTDPMFRVAGPYRTALDEVAHDTEPELNAVLARHATGDWHRIVDRTTAFYGADRARDWLAPQLTTWPARVVTGTLRRQQLLDDVNEMFSLDRMRPIAQADVAAADERDLDFAAHVDRSVLPLMLSLAREHGLRLCFARAMRRPEAWGTTPSQSRALRLYIRDLRQYLGTHGADLLDDYDDPALSRLDYDDGYHLARGTNVEYTDLFWPRLSSLPQ